MLLSSPLLAFMILCAVIGGARAWRRQRPIEGVALAGAQGALLGMIGGLVGALAYDYFIAA